MCVATDKRCASDSSLDQSLFLNADQVLCEHPLFGGQFDMHARAHAHAHVRTSVRAYVRTSFQGKSKQNAPCVGPGILRLVI